MISKLNVRNMIFNKHLFSISNDREMTLTGDKLIREVILLILHKNIFYNKKHVTIASFLSSSKSSADFFSTALFQYIRSSRMFF